MSYSAIKETVTTSGFSCSTNRNKEVGNNDLQMLGLQGVFSVSKRKLYTTIRYLLHSSFNKKQTNKQAIKQTQNKKLGNIKTIKCFYHYILTYSDNLIFYYYYYFSLDKTL